MAKIMNSRVGGHIPAKAEPVATVETSKPKPAAKAEPEEKKAGPTKAGPTKGLEMPKLALGDLQQQEKEKEQQSNYGKAKFFIEVNLIYFNTLV
jgi:hypothetical protein